MPFSRIGWRIAVPAVVVFALLNIGAIRFIREAYPADPFKSEALVEMRRATRFVRFFPNDRTQCYARQPRTSRLEAAAETRQD